MSFIKSSNSKVKLSGIGCPNASGMNGLWSNFWGWFKKPAKKKGKLKYRQDIVNR